MDSPPPRHTWREFLGIRFDHHIAVQERTDCGHTHSYSAINCPPAEEFIRQSDPDPTIVERILESFLSYLARKGCLDDLLPINLDVFLHMLQSRFPRLNLVDEPVIMLFHARLLGVVDMAVEALTSTDAETMNVTLAAPSLIFSQQGDSNWATWNSRTRTHIQTTAIEGKRPRVLFSHTASLQHENNYAANVQQVDGKAMATRVLQSFMYLLVEVLNKPFLNVASPRIILTTVAFWIFFQRDLRRHCRKSIIPARP